MRITKSLAVAASGMALVGAATLPAAAGAGHHPQAASAPTLFKSKASPSHNVHKGKTIKVTSTKAKKSTKYDCVLILIKGTSEGYDKSLKSLTPTTSNSHGHLSCSVKFEAYEATVAGKTRHCPLKKADAKAGFSCAVGVGDAKTLGQTSASFVKFTAHGSAKK